MAAEEAIRITMVTMAAQLLLGWTTTVQHHLGRRIFSKETMEGSKRNVQLADKRKDERSTRGAAADTHGTTVPACANCPGANVRNGEISNTNM